MDLIFIPAADIASNLPRWLRSILGIGFAAVALLGLVCACTGFNPFIWLHDFLYWNFGIGAMPYGT